MIGKEEYTFIKKSTNTRFIADVDLHGLVIRIVFSRGINDIITVLDRNKKSDLLGKDYEHMTRNKIIKGLK